MRSWREQVTTRITEHRGTLADFTGDNFLALFPAALDAVHCALEIQRVIDALNQGLPEHRRMRFRIGAHLGDVREEDGRYFGDGVNVAARLQPLADPGGICLSSTLLETIQGKVQIELTDLGEQHLKNIATPVRAWRTVSTNRTPRQPRRLPMKIAAVVSTIAVLIVVFWSIRTPLMTPDTVDPVETITRPIRSLAVLPLENLSGQPDQDYFADGMTETLIAELAKLPGVRVISRTSSMQFKGRRPSITEIAKVLNAEGIIEGSVMRDGNTVRITTQLIDARDDRHVFAQQYDREIARVFEIQSEIARDVAKRIALTLSPEEASRFLAPAQVDPGAQEAYLRALALKRGRDETFRSTSAYVQEGPAATDPIEDVLRLLQKAVELDPGFARAQAQLALQYTTLAVYRPQRVEDAAELARRAADRAISIDASLADAHHAKAEVAFYFDWDWARAERAYRAAIDLTDDKRFPRIGLAGLLLATGRPGEAFATAEDAVAEVPGDHFVRNGYALLLQLAGRYQDAVAQAGLVLEADPDNLQAITRMGDAYSLAGDWDQVRHWLERQNSLLPADSPIRNESDTWIAGVIQGGAMGYWQARLDSMQAADRPVPAAEAFTKLGNTDAALDVLEAAYAAHNAQMRYLVARNGLKPLHGEPRFQALAHQMNLPLPVEAAAE